MSRKVLVGGLVVFLIVGGLYLFNFYAKQTPSLVESGSAEKTENLNNLPVVKEVNSQICDESKYTLVPIENTGSEGWIRYVNKKYQYSFEYPYNTVCIEDLDVTGGGAELSHEYAYSRENNDVMIYVDHNEEVDMTDDVYTEPTLDSYIASLTKDYVVDKRFITNQGLEAVTLLTTIKPVDNVAYTSRQIVFLKDKTLHVFDFSFRDEATTNRILESIRFEDIKNTEI